MRYRLDDYRESHLTKHVRVIIHKDEWLIVEHLHQKAALSTLLSFFFFQRYLNVHVSRVALDFFSLSSR